jgi:hypothetical protein
MEPTASGSPTTTLHHAPGPVSWFLVVDHVRLDALLQRAGAIDHATYAEFRAGLLKHIGMEEKILLPAAQRARGDEPLRPPPPGCGSIQERPAPLPRGRSAATMQQGTVDRRISTLNSIHSQLPRMRLLP